METVIKNFPIEAKIMLVFDRGNEKAVLLCEKLRPYIHKQPNVIVVVGGDGFMLYAIRKLWQKRLPFFGINVGHRGFLLNEPTVLKKGFPDKVDIHNLPFLDVEMFNEKGSKKLLVFNDAWVERAHSQTAWIKVVVNGKSRTSLMADAALVSTPAGSTAYAMAMGASPLPLDARALILAGSNVSQPFGFKPCYISMDSSVELVSIDPVKRPIVGVVDGHRYGIVSKAKIAVSKFGVQLAFSPDCNLHRKLEKIQFMRVL